jgi:hypothetical protein
VDIVDIPCANTFDIARQVTGKAMKAGIIGAVITYCLCLLPDGSSLCCSQINQQAIQPLFLAN